MRKLLITLCVIAVFVEISGLVLSGTDEKPNEAMTSLMEPPQRKILDPKRNGYFLLLGFAATPSADPLQIGWDIWAEAEVDRGRRLYNYDKAHRAGLRLGHELLEDVQPWVGPNSLLQLQRETRSLRKSIPHTRVFIQRYKRWLGMPFEDWGFGHLGTPRGPEVFVAHRLYLGAGFSHSRARGLARLKRDFAKWRAVMKEAKTLRIKVLAATIVSEDAGILSDLLSQPNVQAKTLRVAARLLRPFTLPERSLQWSIRNEFVVGLSRPEEYLGSGRVLTQDQSGRSSAWLAKMARLYPNAFRNVERSLSATMFGVSFDNQKTLNMYARYYVALIEATESGPGPLPTVHEVAHATPRTLLETLLNPVQDEPEWQHFADRMLEADARIRLAGLQAALRKPSRFGVPVRIARVGSGFFDPFSGFPMLWSHAQKRLYSVGADGLDDGGDATFDIAVPAIIGRTGSIHLSSQRSGKGLLPGHTGGRL